MNLSAMLHMSTEEYIYPRGRHQLVIQLKTARADAKTVELVYWPRYETDVEKRKIIHVPVSLRDKYCDTYRAVIQTDGISAYTRYCFRLTSDTECVWLGNAGPFTDAALVTSNYFEYLWPNRSDGYEGAQWHKNQVFYQIFPERFCNGDHSLTPAGAVPWGSKPTRECFMGGDIPGIIDRLDYIEKLGVSCIYLNPIFEAPSNHKYDTTNYYEIDPSFGTKKDLQCLVNSAHERGLKVILDGVFNHCGYYWPQFQSVVKKGKSSPYIHWFFIHDYPVTLDPCNYDCVGHYKWMPKINLENYDAAQYFINVGKYWIDEFNIDGWRLDVADEIPTSFWEIFSRELKKDHPDILLLGETWGDARKLVLGNRLDSAMNYLFRDATCAWLAQETIDCAQYDHLINRMLSLYPEEVMLRMYNPLDSHDTARFRYLCKDIRKHKLAVAIQMTMPGCPAILYGDEIGLSGDNDPDCRMAMQWDPQRQDRELLSWYCKLIRIRNESESLKSGQYHTIIADSDKNVFCFSRTTAKETTLILINAGAERYKLPQRIMGDAGKWIHLTGNVISQNIISAEEAVQSMECEPVSAEIYQKKVKV